MGAMSIWHWLLVIIVILLLFGGGKITSVMGDLAKGIKSFKRELKEGEEPGATGEVTADPAKLTPPQTPADSQSSSTESGAR